MAKREERAPALSAKWRSKQGESHGRASAVSFLLMVTVEIRGLTVRAGRHVL